MLDTKTFKTISRCRAQLYEAPTVEDAPREEAEARFSDSQISEQNAIDKSDTKRKGE